MAQTDQFRDYLYVSVRKVSRMSKTIRPAKLQRLLRDVQVTLGPLAANLKLGSDSPPQHVLTLIPEVERAIDTEYGIKYVSEADLKVGQWFMIDGVPMSYGVPGDTGGVLFAGEEGTRFIMCGSAKYLLDREVAENPYENWGCSASGLGGLTFLLSMVVQGRLEDQYPCNHPSPLAPDALDGWDINQLFESLAKVLDSGKEPLTAVARCLDIRQADRGTVVLGTPLYVAFSPPE